MLAKIKSFLFKNTTEKQTVAKNSFWLAVSNFGGRAIKAVVIVYAARVLGTAGYGVFSYAITLATFLTIFIDPGVNSILMRDASKVNEAEQRRTFSTMWLLKIALIAIGASVIIFIAPSFSTLPGAKLLLPIVACILALDATRDFFTAFLRSQERMEWDAGIYLAANVGILVFGYLFLQIQTSPSAFTWGYVAGDVLGVMVASIVIRKYFRNFLASIDLKRILPILGEAWPFAVTGALAMLLTSADILIMSWMRTASDVGIYSAAIRIVQILYLVPMVFQFSTLPLLGRLAHADPPRFRAALERVIKLILLTATPLALGGVILGTQIMTFLFGGPYAAGGLAFKLLMVGLLFDFPTAVISSAIFAYNHQRSLIVTSAIGGLVNVGLDLLLIPRFGITGSAVATLFAQFLSNWYLWHIMKKLNYFEVMPALGRVLVAGLVMAFAVGMLSLLHVHLLLNIAAGAIVYALALYLLREPMLREVKNVFFPPVEAAA